MNMNMNFEGILWRKSSILHRYFLEYKCRKTYEGKLELEFSGGETCPESILFCRASATGSQITDLNHWNGKPETTSPFPSLKAILTVILAKK
jgi:hypothetical protein